VGRILNEVITYSCCCGLIFCHTSR